MAKKVKLADIGAQLGVSAVTVSKALSDQEGVSAQMRAKIKALAEDLGYQPPRSEKEKKIKSYNIGILISEKFFNQMQSFYWRVYQELAVRAAAKECFTMLEIVSNEDEKSLSLPRLFEGNKVDGFIILGLMSSEYLDHLEANLSVPYIFLDFYRNEKDADAVVTDNFLGMYRLVNHLIDMGHKKIAYVGTLMSTNSITDRYFGYCKSLVEHGIELKNDYIIDDRVYVNNDLLRPEDFSFPKEMPTAFACNCDMSAVLLMKALEFKGIRVPEDVSVVGFDNYLAPGVANPNLTTCEVDVREMAAQSIRILIAKINGEDYKKGILTVPGKIMLGDTVKPIK